MTTTLETNGAPETEASKDQGPDTDLFGEP